MLNHTSVISLKQPFHHLRNSAKVHLFISQADTERLMHAFITIRLDYCNALFSGLSLESYKYADHSVLPVLKSLHWLPVRFFLLVLKSLDWCQNTYVLYAFNVNGKCTYMLFQSLYDSKHFYITCLIHPFTHIHTLMCQPAHQEEINHSFTFILVQGKQQHLR